MDINKLRSDSGICAPKTQPKPNSSPPPPLPSYVFNWNDLYIFLILHPVVLVH